MSTSIAGRVAIVPQGEYSSTTQYDRLDLVTSSNKFYIAKKKPPVGTALTDTTYWTEIIDADRCTWGKISGTLTNQTDLKNALDGKSATGHTHDDRYYTETEIDTQRALSTQQLTDLKVLGWTVPTACPIQNEVNSDGKFVQKVGRVDLGSLSWTYNASEGLFYSSAYTIKQKGLGFCNGYNVGAYTYPMPQDKSISTYWGWYSSYSVIVIRNDSYTDATAFKSAMSGVYLYYELATPITLPIDGGEIYTETDDLQFLGWTVPREMPIKNYVDSNGDFHQRVGRVNLGELSWTKQSTDTGYRFENANSISDMIAISDIYVVSNIFCASYSAENSIGTWNGVKGIATFGKRCQVVDTSYTDATQFRSAMANTYLYYELATEVVIKCGKEKTALNSVGDEWTSKTYSIGDYVIYQNALYKAILDIPSGCPPTNTSYWKKTSVNEELAVKSGTPSLNYPVWVNDYTYCKRNGNIVEIGLAVQLSGTALTEYVIGNVPEGFRPKNYNMSTIISTDGGSHWNTVGFSSFKPNGDVTVTSEVNFNYIMAKMVFFN